MTLLAGVSAVVWVLLAMRGDLRDSTNNCSDRLRAPYQTTALRVLSFQSSNFQFSSRKLENSLLDDWKLKLSKPSSRPRIDYRCIDTRCDREAFSPFSQLQQRWTITDSSVAAP